KANLISTIAVVQNPRIRVLEWHRALGRPVDGASLAVCRIAVGLEGAVSIGRLFANGWIEALYVAPQHHLRFPGLAWVPVPPPWGVRTLAVVAGLAALATALGWRHRAAAALFALTFTWLEFVEATTFLNHYWLVSLMAALMVVVPANHAWSLDARAGRAGGPVPVGAVLAIRLQLAAVYFFAGVAKLHPDWLFDGDPLRLWLPGRGEVPLIGPLLAAPGAALALSWAGALFDLTIVGFLLMRRTRLWAWLAVVVFHVVTWALFPQIGVFPWVMIALTTIFFAPDWLRRLVARTVTKPTPALPERAGWPAFATVALVIWVTVQVLLPIRHLAYHGDARWTGEGFRFAWNVLAVEKVGWVSFHITDSKGRTWVDDGSGIYTESQLRVATAEPDMIAQMARALADEEGAGAEVRVDAYVSINGGEAERMIDPNIDLASLHPGTRPIDFVLAQRRGGITAAERSDP
ncbi:MAG: HTTM domain-containing protein, partial [Acidimicrobiia bacterium]